MQTQPFAPKELIGSVLNNRYKLVECLHTGNLAFVYRAYNSKTKSDVAVKLLRVDASNLDKDLKKRFLRETFTTSLINHPNVIKIYEIGESNQGIPYFCMELLTGLTLSEALQENEFLSLDRTAQIFSSTCRAIHAAHAIGLVHRDIKPSNIFLHQIKVEEKIEECIKVLDFGIAKPGWGGTLGSSVYVSGSGTIIGTPKYMSPEQCQGDPVCPRSDIYSLGIVLYKMLTGHTPFDGPPTLILAHHISIEPPPLRMYRPNLPIEFEEIVMKALSKDPKERYNCVLEFAAIFMNEVSKQTHHISSNGLHRTVSPPEVEDDAVASQTLILSPAEIGFLVSNASLPIFVPEQEN